MPTLFSLQNPFDKQKKKFAEPLPKMLTKPLGYKFCMNDISPNDVSQSDISPNYISPTDICPNMVSPFVHQTFVRSNVCPIRC